MKKVSVKMIFMKWARMALVLILAFMLTEGKGEKEKDGKEQKSEPGRYIVMFWNLENYFDTFDDPQTSDNEFTPFGERHWSWKKFMAKRNGIAKVIISAGEGTNYPALVALAEVENRFVLEQLVRSTPLALLNYGIVHRDSPDERGIDVALLYRKDVFRPLSVNFVHVPLPDSTAKTRLILYVKGVLEDLDTLHMFVNHWPSKFGGEEASLPNRVAAANVLKNRTDSLFSQNVNANILLTGDFNDTPDSHIFNVFDKFTNLAKGLFVKGEGTIRYKGKWELIDQFMVSGNLLNRKEPIFCDSLTMKIYRPPFLLEKDKEYLGTKPKRSYTGPRYNGGISDHLPVVISIEKMDTFAPCM